MKIVKILVLFLALFTCSGSLLASDNQEHCINFAEPLTVTMSQTEIEQFIVYLRYCSDDEQCMMELKQAASSALVVPSSCSQICSCGGFSENYAEIISPMFLSLFAGLAGYLLGGLSESTPPPTLGARIGCSIVLYLVGFLIYSNAPIAYRKRIDAIADDPNGVKKFIKTINMITLESGERIMDIQKNYLDSYDLIFFSKTLFEKFHRTKKNHPAHSLVFDTADHNI